MSSRKGYCRFGITIEASKGINTYAERGLIMKKNGLFVLGCWVILLIFSPLANGTMSTFIPGAHSVHVQRLDDLTTNNPLIGKLAEVSRLALFSNEWSTDGKVGKKPGWYTPKEKIPGLQIEGMFEDARFVIRLPDKWNGKLVMAGIPGTRDERSADDVFSDYVLTKKDPEGRSYAYAATDKGTTGEMIPAPDGKIYPFAKGLTTFVHPKDRIAEWLVRLKELTIATQDLFQRLRGQRPGRTYLMGISNGGYLVRTALEKEGSLFDGGVDWEGVLWRAQEPNLLSSLVEALNNYRIYADPNAPAVQKTEALNRLSALGLPEGSEILWPFHAQYYYLGAINNFRNAYDPTFLKRNWWEYGLNPQDYKEYDYFKRPASVREEIAKFENTGNIQKPLITVHGTWDALIFANVHALPYEKLVKERKKETIYRLYMVDKGNHLDSLVGKPGMDPGKTMQPLLPYVHQAFDLLVDWVESGKVPPPSKTIGKATGEGKVLDLLTGAEINPY